MRGNRLLLLFNNRGFSRTGLLLYARQSTALYDGLDGYTDLDGYSGLGEYVDSIGLSIDDYLLVPAEHRSIYFSDETTMRTIEEIITNIEASEYLNDGGELVGNSTNGYVQYADGTALSILLKAYKYLDETYPTGSATYWQRVDDTNILRVDDSTIEVF